MGVRSRSPDTHAPPTRDARMLQALRTDGSPPVGIPGAADLQDVVPTVGPTFVSAVERSTQ